MTPPTDGIPHLPAKPVLPTDVAVRSPRHASTGPGGSAVFDMLSPAAKAHLVRLAFMFGVAVPSGTRRNKARLRQVREDALERLLVEIARDPDAFEAAAAQCDWTTQ